MTDTTSRRRAPASPAVWVVRAIVGAYLFLLVGWPTAFLLRHTFADGLHALTVALSDPDVVHALTLTLQTATMAVAINLVFGVGMSLLLARYDFVGKRLLSWLIDLPLAASPVVVGLALLLVYSPVYGWFGPALRTAGIEVAFATPGIVMATCFVALPLIIREVVPVLTELGDDQEQAARSLGAGAWQTFCRITLPGIRWALAYGVVLSLARSLGEFGAVKVVSGHVIGQTATATIAVESAYQNNHTDQAYAIAFVLVFAAVLCLIAVALLHRQDAREKG
ncbi:sulfate ABC transporter permease subunit [Microbacterium protaetiae]|uniref:Sulfate ABC transporter permease subunit n=1 Tax=Microbacterium protaetiae TaxID=2509458 RepID=A0A4V0YDK7_9MICO|nr:sulfate ABC transporter permease subunit [Microbacterium protaetiae]QAY61051.1 sulfate ABC transporter permease subunit [Microbacterium protaetiae]